MLESKDFDITYGTESNIFTTALQQFAAVSETRGLPAGTSMSAIDFAYNAVRAFRKVRDEREVEAPIVIDTVEIDEDNRGGL
jgi:hypothetical protein